jgi:lia operon protein LiaG
MSRRWGWTRERLMMPALGLWLIAFHGGDVAAQSARQRFALGTGTIAIYNLAGELTVEPGSGPEVVVEVVRGGRDAAKLRVETGPRQGMQTLRVIYPRADRVVYPPMGRGTRSSVEVGSDGSFGDHDHGMGWLAGKRRVTVSGSGEGVEAWANVRVSVPRGQKLRLQWVAGATRIGAVEGDLRVDNSSGTVEVHGMRGKLEVDTGSGDVVVKDVQGDIGIDTGSGGVTIQNTRGGVMSLDTGSGEIRASEVTVDKLVADTGSGGIELDQVHAPVVLLDTGSGHVDLDLSSDVEKVEVDTGSGGVTMTVPAKTGAEFDIETGSGGIDVDVPHETISIERDRVRGRLGDGQGRIHVDTGSGGVRLLRRATTSERSGAVLGYQLVPQVG